MPANIPIFVMSFNRPHYLTRVLESLRQQVGCDIENRNIILFQDGSINAFSKKRYAQDTDVKNCIKIFNSMFPNGKTQVSSVNLGVALNFDRAEKYGFEKLKADYIIFLEDDLILSAHYIAVLETLIKRFSSDDRVGYISAYGHYNRPLDEQRANRDKLIPLYHNWGFALYRRQWEKIRPYILDYLKIVEDIDYRERDNQKISDLFKSWGFGCPATSQDAAKTIACCVGNVIKINTYICNAKYIGEHGLHMNPALFQKRGFANTVLYPERVKRFEILDEGRYQTILKAQLAWAGKPVSKGSIKLPPVDAANPSAALVRAAYRALLQRDPDPDGMAAYMRLFEANPLAEALEIALERLVKSAEFARRQQAEEMTSPSLEIEYLCHSLSGRDVWFAVDRAAKDSYTLAIRKAPIRQSAVTHLQRLYRIGRRHLKLADFGANIGTVSLPAACLCDASVLAVEGLSKNVALLSAAVLKNGLGGRVIPAHIAASDAINVVPMGGSSAWGAIQLKGGGQPTPSGNMAQILGLFGFENADLIKLDIEGAEMRSLTDSTSVLSVYRHTDVIFESNTHTCGVFRYRPQDLWRHFISLGYSLYAFHGDRLFPLSATDPQHRNVIDVLATRTGADILIKDYGYRVSRMLDSELLEFLEHEIKGSLHQQQHVAAQIDFLSKGVREDPRWKSIADTLPMLSERFTKPVVSTLSPKTSGRQLSGTDRPDRTHPKTAAGIADKLFGDNVLAGYQPALPEDLQGWNSNHPVFRDLIASLKVKTILDVGVWKGGSTIELSSLLKEFNIDGAVIAIDTFLGSTEHWNRGRTDRIFDSLLIGYGYPQLYWQFISNVKHRGCEEYVVPLPQTTENAIRILQMHGIRADLIHLDAAHEYEAVVRDALGFWDLLNPGGFLVGDDYHPSWPGVIRAATEFSTKVGVELALHEPKWVLQKPVRT
jgi:FkbM family methyltransferase